MYLNKVIIKVNSTSIFPNVVEYGLQIAKKWTYPLLLFDVKEIDNVSQKPTGWGKLDAGRMLTSANRKLKRLTRELRKVWKSSHYELMAGDPVEKSVKKINHWVTQANKAQPNLLIIGREDNDSYLNNWSQTEGYQITQKVECPALIVPKKYEYKSPRNILYVMNEDIEMVKKQLNYLVKLAAPFNSVISIACLGEERLESRKINEIHQHMSRKLRYPRFQFHNYCQCVSPETIIPFADAVQTNMLVIPRKRKGFFDKFYESEQTRNFITKPNIPVLIF
jgi:hypothetical protein